MRITVLFVYLAALLLSRVSFANNCKELGTELDSMRKAQNQIMMSLVRNHHDFADNMSELADDISMGTGKVSRASLMSIKKMSQSYRTRGDKGQVIAEKLDLASTDLISRLKKCLK